MTFFQFTIELRKFFTQTNTLSYERVFRIKKHCFKPPSGWENLITAQETGKKVGKKLRRNADVELDDELDEEPEDVFKENAEFFESDD